MGRDTDFEEVVETDEIIQPKEEYQGGIGEEVLVEEVDSSERVETE